MTEDLNASDIVSQLYLGRLYVIYSYNFVQTWQTKTRMSPNGNEFIEYLHAV